MLQTTDRPQAAGLGDIYFLTERGHAFTIGILLDCFPCAARDRIKLLSYEQLFRIDAFAPGAFVFTDFDRLSPKVFARVQAFARHLAQSRPSFPILNHPDKVLGRFDLLTELPRRGLGTTAAHRITNWRSVVEFPVFIRHECGHEVPITGLIRNKAELEAAVSRHWDPDTASAADLIIVKFLDYADAGGIFRKYGAIRIGPRIYGDHLFHSKQWVVKLANRETGQTFRQEALDYCVANLHAERLRPYFDAAGIDFGRADYCMIDGEVGLFEINTNPSFISEPPMSEEEYGHHEFFGTHDEALMAIPSATGTPLKMPAQLREPGRPLCVHTAHLRSERRLKGKIRRHKRRLRKKAAIKATRDWIGLGRS